MIDYSKYKYIIGVDECGTGSIAGPLAVSGVKAPTDWTMDGLKDSKKLKKVIFKMQDNILANFSSNNISYHIAQRSNQEIDSIGLAKALKDAYVEIFHKLYEPDSLIITDGTLKFDNLGVDNYDKISLIKADTKIPTVMAASILGKAYRDKIMHDLHTTYPKYDFISNVGYSSKKHLEAIKSHGYSDIHRRSYKIKSLV